MITPLTKVVAGAAVVAVIVAGVLGLQLKAALKENGALSGQVSQLTQSLKDAAADIKQLKLDAIADQELIIEGDKAKKQLRADKAKRRAEYEKTKTNAPEFEEWSDRPLPVPVIDWVRQGRSGEDEASGEAPTEGSVDDGDSA